MSRLICLTPSPKIDYELLIKDPQSLCTYTPTQSVNVVRNLVKEGLPSIITNPTLMGLFSSPSEGEKLKLVSDLSSMEPFDVMVANYIYSKSNIAIKDQITGKFSASSSIRMALSSKGIVSESVFSSSVEQTDHEVMRYYTKKMERRGVLLTLDELFLFPCSTCTYRIAQHLRRVTWQKEILGATMPVPYEQVTLSPWNTVKCPDKSIAIFFNCDNPKLCYFYRGPNDPYIGSSTMLRKRKSNLEIINVDDTVACMVPLLLLKDWITDSSENNHLRNLLETLIEEKTDIPLDLLEQVSDKVVGGVVSHRLPVTARPRGFMINNLFTASTHAFAISKKAEDFSICFQSILLLALYKTTRHCHVTKTTTSSMAAEFTCSGCTTLVDTEHFTLPAKHDYTGVKGPSFIKELQVINHNLLQAGGPQDPRTSASIYQAFHWAKFIKYFDRSLSILPEDDSSADAFPSFLNILEFSRYSVKSFFTYLLWFLVLFDRGEITSAWNTINRYSHLGQLAGPLKTLDAVLLSAV